MSTALTVPTTRELQSLGAAARWDLEDKLDSAQDILREFNDDELRCWVEVGKTSREIGALVGRDHSRVVRRATRLGLQFRDNRGGDRSGAGAPNESADPDAELVEGQIVPPTRRNGTPPDGPAHHLPDVVAPDAEENLRTQALHWFEQGLVVRELLDRKRPLEPRSEEDRKAIKREAALMERVARQIKERC